MTDCRLAQSSFAAARLVQCAFDGSDLNGQILNASTPPRSRCTNAWVRSCVLRMRVWKKPFLARPGLSKRTLAVPCSIWPCWRKHTCRCQLCTGAVALRRLHRFQRPACLIRRCRCHRPECPRGRFLPRQLGAGQSARYSTPRYRTLGRRAMAKTHLAKELHRSQPRHQHPYQHPRPDAGESTMQLSSGRVTALEGERFGVVGSTGQRYWLAAAFSCLGAARGGSKVSDQPGRGGRLHPQVCWSAPSPSPPACAWMAICRSACPQAA